MNYDLSITGGGLSGLSLSILAARAGYKTILFEKESYPFHRVCGEYISMESMTFLSGLGVPLNSMQLPILKRLNLSAPSGKILNAPLDMGGFGISRYKLDHLLAEIALKEGVEILQKTKVTDIQFRNNHFDVYYHGGIIQSTIAVAAFGKRSNLDIRFQRPFIQRKAGKLNNYLGVKYHIQLDHPTDLIALHNFDKGYCGISAIEDGRFCLCYMTDASNLKKFQTIADMEKMVLYKNPVLADIFTRAKFLFNEPVTISQISFQSKSTVENHILMLGDAAGLIAPLCGNGMSMAFHTSKIAFEEIHAFLRNEIPRKQMEINYLNNWKKHFSQRLNTGKIIQTLFYKESTAELLLALMRPFPAIVQQIIRRTHGVPFG